MIIDGKIYRNLPQQVEKNKDDIAKLQEGFTQSGYTKAEADAKFADKIDTENSITEIQTYINSDKKAMAKLQAKVDKNTTDISAQDSKIETATEAATNASGVAQNAYTAATAAKEATDATTVQVNELTSAVDALDLYTSTLNTDLQSTKNRVTAAEGNIDELTTKLDDYALKTEIPTDFYTKEQSDGKYQLKGDYALKSDIPTDFYTKAESNEKYQPKGTYVVPSDLDIYEKKSDLNTTLEGYVTSTSLGTTLEDYALKTEIPTDFYTKAQSDRKYQLKGDYVTTAGLTTTLDDYALKTEIPTDFYTKSESDGKYQPKGTYVVPGDLDVYEKKSDLNTTLEGYVTTTVLGTTLEDYALKTEIPTDFYTKTQSDEKYALKTEIPTDFYTRAQSDEKYQVKGDYVVSATLANYSTTEQMNSAINTAITGAIEGAY